MTADVHERDARRRRRRFRRLLLLGTLAAVGFAVVVANLDFILGDPEQRAIAAERAKRRSLWLIGNALPGTPDLGRLSERLSERGFTLSQPILVRIFKREFELEIWKERGGRLHHFATYPICRWSGRLGPKFQTGDRQAPEGFYAVGSGALNPASRWRRSFNLGFPNAFDRAHGRTGSYLMVHGGCSSVGCYAMTDAVIDEIWHLVTAALAGGQRRFQVQAFPFRMTAENLAAKEGHPNHAFWSSLKAGSDLFEASGLPPRTRVCGGEYVFLPGRRVLDGASPALAQCPEGKGRDPRPQS